MPVLVLAARMCPEGVEATLFATLMSILNGGAFTGSALGAGLTALLGVTSDDFSHLFTLTLICVLTTLAPLPFLNFLPASLDTDATSNSGMGGKAAVALAEVTGKLAEVRGKLAEAGRKLRGGRGGAGSGAAAGEEVGDEERAGLLDEMERQQERQQLRGRRGSSSSDAER